MNHTADVQGDWPGGKRSKDAMKTPCETSTEAIAITATPQPKRSKKEPHEGDPDAEMELLPGPPTVTEHFVVATPTRQRSPPTISPTQPFNHTEARAIVVPTPSNAMRNLPSLQVLEGAQINLIAQQSALGEARSKVQQEQRSTATEAMQTGPTDHEKVNILTKQLEEMRENYEALRRKAKQPAVIIPLLTRLAQMLQKDNEN